MIIWISRRYEYIDKLTYHEGLIWYWGLELHIVPCVNFDVADFVHRLVFLYIISNRYGLDDTCLLLNNSCPTPLTSQPSPA